MILNNYWIYKATVADKLYTGDAGYNDNIAINCRPASQGSSYSSVEIKSHSGGYAPGYSSNYSDRMNLAPRFGTGDTAVSANDYELDTDVTSSFGGSSLNTSLSFENGVYKTVFLISAHNNTVNDITLKEIGIVKRMDGTGAGDFFDYLDIMFIRHVLDEPVTVPSSETRTFTYEWDQT